MNASNSVGHGYAAVPFVLWTLRRTGGSNLTQRLVDRSGLEAAPEHEPFNVDRVYGYVTQDWLDTKDEILLAGAMRVIAARNIIIKHAVEMVPWEISRALANATVLAGYRHLFLYRANARDRLMSLHFAEQTGIWGLDMKYQETNESTLSGIRLPVDALIRHQQDCVEKISMSWRYLLALGQQPMALSYEKVFRTDHQQAEAVLLPILNVLGLSHGKSGDHDFVTEVLGTGDQGTSGLYETIPGAADLNSGLKHIPQFEPESNVEHLVFRNSGTPEWVLEARIDSYPKSFTDGQIFSIGGVVVLGQESPDDITLHFASDGKEWDINWGIESPEMAELFPDAQQSGKARFNTKDTSFPLGQEFELYLSDGASHYTLFKLFADKYVSIGISFG